MKKNTNSKKIPTWLIAVVVAIVICFAGFALYRSVSRTTPQTPTATPTPIIQLPKMWSTVSSKNSDNTIKVERQTKSGIKPTVVFSSVTSKVKDPAAYVSKLQKGAFFGIPSLAISAESTETKNGVYTDNMEANYQNGEDTVYVVQRIVIGPTKVYTLTGSMGSDDKVLKKEIRDIFDLLQKIYGN